MGFARVWTTLRHLRSASVASAALASALGLVVEVTYTRIASVMLWSAFVYMVIGIALMGFGLPGILVALWRNKIEVLVRPRLHWLWVALAASSLLPLALLPWFTESLVFYAAFAAALALPFAVSGLVCVLAFTSGADVRRVAAGSTLGGMCGAVLAASLAPFLGVPLLLILSSAVSLTAFALVSHGRGVRAAALLSLALVAALGLGLRDVVLPGQALKWYPLFSQLPHFEREFTRWDPVARIDIADFRGEFRTPEGPVPFKLLTQDYTAPSFFMKFGAPATRGYLQRRIESAGYWARPNPRKALIIGIGGGPDVQAALVFGAQEIEAVEINATTIDLLRGRYDAWVGGIGNDPRVRLIHDDGGHYLRSTRLQYDHIQMSGVDTDVASVSGTSRIAENYLYTKELINTAFGRLTADGLLVFAWADYSQFLPVKERMFVTMLEVLADRQLSNPGRHLAVVGAGGTFSILMKRSPFEPAEIARLETQMRLPFPESFEMLYRLLPHHPQITPTRAQVHYAPGSTAAGFFTDALAQLTAGRRWNALSATFNLNPTTDDRPFFFIVDRPDGSMVTVKRHLDVLLVAGLVAAVLLLLPVIGRWRGTNLRAEILPLAGLGALGWGFAAAQVVFLQMSVYIIGHPALAVAVVIAALLGSMTAGNLLSARLTVAPGWILWIACLGLCGLLAAFGTLHAVVAELVDPAPLAIRVGAAALLVAVPGLFMGVPFPLSLQMLAASRPATLPWALAANAAANVLSMVATSIACWFIGFTWTLVFAASTYAFGTALVFLAMRSGLSGKSGPAISVR